MPDYTQGKIYKLTSSQTKDVYVGSTTYELRKRLWYHKNNIKAGDNISSKELLKYSDCKIELLEDYPCENNEQLREREQYYIDTLPNVINKIRSVVKPQQQRTKEYRKNNPEKVKESYANWRETHLEQEANRQATYFYNNKEALQAKHKERDVQVECPICKKIIKKYSLPRHNKNVHD